VEDPVGWQIGADVDVLPGGGKAGVARRPDGDQRTGFGIGAAEGQEVASPVKGQDDQVALDVAWRQTRGLAGDGSLPGGLANRGRRGLGHCHVLSVPCRHQPPPYDRACHQGLSGNGSIGASDRSNLVDL